MSDTKSILTSTTVWGAAAAVAAGVAGLFGVGVDDATTAQLGQAGAATASAVANHDWGTVAVSGLSVLGGLVSFIGRLRAKKQVTITGK